MNILAGNLRSAWNPQNHPAIGSGKMTWSEQEAMLKQILVDLGGQRDDDQRFVLIEKLRPRPDNNGDLPTRTERELHDEISKHLNSTYFRDHSVARKSLQTTMRSYLHARNWVRESLEDPGKACQQHRLTLVEQRKVLRDVAADLKIPNGERWANQLAATCKDQATMADLHQMVVADLAHNKKWIGRFGGGDGDKLTKALDEHAPEFAPNNEKWDYDAQRKATQNVLDALEFPEGIERQQLTDVYRNMSRSRHRAWLKAQLTEFARLGPLRDQVTAAMLNSRLSLNSGSSPSSPSNVPVPPVVTVADLGSAHDGMQVNFGLVHNPISGHIEAWKVREDGRLLLTRTGRQLPAMYLGWGLLDWTEDQMIASPPRPKPDAAPNRLGHDNDEDEEKKEFEDEDITPNSNHYGPSSPPSLYRQRTEKRRTIDSDFGIGGRIFNLVLEEFGLEPWMLDLPGINSDIEKRFTEEFGINNDYIGRKDDAVRAGKHMMSAIATSLRNGHARVPIEQNRLKDMIRTAELWAVRGVPLGNQAVEESE